MQGSLRKHASTSLLDTIASIEDDHSNTEQGDFAEEQSQQPEADAHEPSPRVFSGHSLTLSKSAKSSSKHYTRAQELRELANQFSSSPFGGGGSGVILSPNGSRIFSNTSGSTAVTSRAASMSPATSLNLRHHSLHSLVQHNTSNPELAFGPGSPAVPAHQANNGSPVMVNRYASFTAGHAAR